MNQKTVVAGALFLSTAVAVFFLFRSPETASPISAVSNPGLFSQVPPAKTPAEPISGGTSPRPLGANNPQGLVLDQILASRNDNDPRMDSELRTLDEATKDLFREKYQALALEKRNDRGTIVFLLGRNLKTEKDYAFFCDVLREAPCFNLADCRGNAPNISGADYHHDSGEQVTLAYPQYVALTMLGSQKGSEEATRTLGCAQDSKVEAIREKAGDLLRDRASR